MFTTNDEAIVVRGARVHNLKNVHVVIPRDRMTVITGPSGSGKSSLAFDTIYAEGQRRYVESLSTYARQFLVQMGRPDVESISGLSPTISIEQKTTSYNPRSTVGTVTEVYDHLRLLFARIGKPYCWKCGNAIQSQSPQQIVDQILATPPGTRLSLLAPIVRGRKGEYQKELQTLRQNGFARVKVDGETLDLADEITLDKNKKHDIEVYVDRFVFKGDIESLSTRIFESVELALKLGEGLLILESQNGESTDALLMSTRFACLNCQLSYPEPEPRTFSFNSPMGACAECDGLGTRPVADEQEIPRVCTSCLGMRLKQESLHFKIIEKNIAELCQLSLSDLALFFDQLTLTEREKLITHRIVKEVKDRLFFLTEVGVGYLSLGRSAQSLSGGEAQRIRLATQIGSSLVGVIYVLDEPSIGLHQRDNEKLISMLLRLRDLGNTVLVVEHDRDMMEKADWIVDLGPGAGNLGGSVVAEGSYQDLLKLDSGLTSKYLRGDLEIPIPKKRRTWDSTKVLKIENARQNNLQNVSVSIPLGVFTCVTGVSGSGKSTLIIDTLYPALSQVLYGATERDLQVKAIRGLDFIDKVIDIDQSPIGKTPRSNPATYTGLFSLIRGLFAQLPESQARGYGPGRYSFNVKGGRCEKCQGDGLMKVEMHFLPDVYIECEICRGKRYHNETLEIRFKGKNISEVLEMTVADALSFFDAIPTIKSKLFILNEVGLGYLHVGQSATTLSGGEAQRIKLAKELSKRSTGKTLYILDEPSTGLHFEDIRKLVSLLQSLVDQGNSVVVIEHNLDILKVADHIIDLGPEGGKNGGCIVAVGTPEEIVKVKNSYTGKFLKEYI